MLGRSFAQIGLPAANLFLGEILLVGAIAVRRLRSGFSGAVQALMQPNPLHVMTWAILGFLAYGVFHVALAVYGGAHVVEVLKIFVFNYYVVLIFLGIRLGLLIPNLLERLCRALPWGVGAYLLLSLAHINFSLPLSAAVGLYDGAAAPIGMLLIITLEHRFVRRLPAFAICAFSWLYFQIRGDWLGVIAAVIAWGVVTKRLRHVLAGLAACALVFMYARLRGDPDRSIGLQGWCGRRQGDPRSSDRALQQGARRKARTGRRRLRRDGALA